VQPPPRDGCQAHFAKRLKTIFSNQTNPKNPVRLARCRSAFTMQYFRNGTFSSLFFLLHPISHRFDVIADYWSNLRFQQRGTPLWHTRSGWTPKLRTTKFSRKKLETLLYCMDGIHILITIRANIDWKSPFLKGVGHFGPIFQVQADVPTNHLCTDR